MDIQFQLENTSGSVLMKFLDSNEQSENLDEQLSIKDNKQDLAIDLNTIKDEKHFSEQGDNNYDKLGTKYIYNMDSLNDFSNQKKKKKLPLRLCANVLCNIYQQDYSFIGQKNNLTKIKMRKGSDYFCLLCAKAYKKGQFCDYCEQIYHDSSIDGICNDDRKWIECESCKKWVHVDCEEKFRNNKLSKQLDTINFYCVNCKDNKRQRNKKKVQRKTKLSLTNFSNSVNIKNKFLEQSELDKEESDGSIKNGEQSQNIEVNHWEKCPLVLSYQKKIKHNAIQLFQRFNLNKNNELSIDGLMNNYGHKLLLSENELHEDINMLNKIILQLKN